MVKEIDKLELVKLPPGLAVEETVGTELFKYEVGITELVRLPPGVDVTKEVAVVVDVL